MNCLASRRLLLSAPRVRHDEHRRHLAMCAECTRFAGQIETLDRRMEEAARITPPDALAHRVLRARHHRPLRQYVAAAAVVLLSVTVTLTLPAARDAVGLSPPVQAVGPSHPAIRAIDLVVYQQPVLLDEGRIGDIALLEQGLRRLGLSIKEEGVAVQYVGPCHLPDAPCAHVVLRTAHGRVSVILLSNYPVDTPVMVADRRLTALVTPAGSGSYIVVAESATAAKRAGKLFVHG